MITDLRVLPWQNTLLDNMGVVEAMRRGGLVRRFHTHPHIIGQQTVAEHSFNMACLYVQLHHAPQLITLAAILMHDVAEAAVGDVPSPAKWANDDLRKALDDSERHVRERFFLTYEEALGPEEARWLKFCDLFEGAMFSRDQIVMGNISCQITFELFMLGVKRLKEGWGIKSDGWPEDLEAECLKLIQHYTQLTGEHFKWQE